MASRRVNRRLIAKIEDYIGYPHGWCYVVSEALYYYLGGKKAGLKPMQASIEVDGQHLSHWWLVDSDNVIIDLTSHQFDFPFPYHLGKGRGFMPKMKADTVELLEYISETTV